MHNYAYKIGKLVKFGIDQSKSTVAKRGEDLQITADIAAEIFGIHKIDVELLWIREAKSRGDAQMLESVLIKRFKDQQAVGNEWIRADDKVVSFFLKLQNDPEWANQWVRQIMISVYGYTDSEI